MAKRTVPHGEGDPLHSRRDPFIAQAIREDRDSDAKSRARPMHAGQRRHEDGTNPGQMHHGRKGGR